MITDEILKQLTDTREASVVIERALAKGLIEARNRIIVLEGTFYAIRKADAALEHPQAQAGEWIDLDGSCWIAFEDGGIEKFTWRNALAYFHMQIPTHIMPYDPAHPEKPDAPSEATK